MSEIYLWVQKEWKNGSKVGGEGDKLRWRETDGKIVTTNEEEVIKDKQYNHVGRLIYRKTVSFWKT